MPHRIPSLTPLLAISLLIVGTFLSGYSIAGAVKTEVGSDSVIEAAPQAIAIMEAYLKEQAARFKPHPILKDADQKVISHTEAAAIKLSPRDTANAKALAPITVDYPLNKSIFPPDMVPPTFLWHDPAMKADTWLIEVTLGKDAMRNFILSAGRPRKAVRLTHGASRRPILCTSPRPTMRGHTARLQASSCGRRYRLPRQVSPQQSRYTEWTVPGPTRRCQAAG